jgi:hypothetical protein
MLERWSRLCMAAGADSAAKRRLNGSHESFRILALALTQSCYPAPLSLGPKVRSMAASLVDPRCGLVIRAVRSGS